MFGNNRKRTRARTRVTGVNRLTPAQIAVPKQSVLTSPLYSSDVITDSIDNRPVSENERIIVCYYTNWSQYRPTLGKFLPENIDPFLCTHIIFAFSSMKNNRLVPFEHNDESEDGKPGLYERVNALKKANSRLKVLLAIGGWTFGTKKFKDMTGNRYNRRTFVFSVAEHLRERDFDGLDLDWEYPKGSTDKANLANLVTELAEAFAEEAKQTGRERLLLSAAVPVGPDNVRGGYDVPKLARALDFFNIMAYDYHGKWESQAGHNAPLNAPSSDSKWRQQLSVNASVHMWMRLGAPRHKIVVGMPTYGRSFTLSNSANTNVNAPSSGGGTAGVYTKEAGFLAYYEICELLYDGATYIWDDEMSVPYLIAKGNQWVGFDDERSIRIKMDFVRDMGLAGAMVWSIDMDDFQAKACRGAKYPLVTAMREELMGVSRGDKKPDIDWARVARSPAIADKSDEDDIILSSGPYKTFSASDLLAILKAQGSSIDKTVLERLQAALARSASPSVQSLLSSGSVANVNSIESTVEPHVFCYVSSWARDRPGAGRFSPANLDASLCTHAVWTFGRLLNGRVQLPSADQDPRDQDSDYRQLMELRRSNTDLKVLLAIGGWEAGPEPFESLSASNYRMDNFIYETVDFLRKLKFDGLDIDWEYPTGADQRGAYTRLVREFRLAFNAEAESTKQPRLLLTAALPASVDAMADGYDVQEISKHLDFMNIMSYDFHGSWDSKVGHNSPLFALEKSSPSARTQNLDYAVRAWLDAGAPPEKTLVGLSTYGRSFTLNDTELYDIGSPVAGPGKPARFTREAGFVSYFEICEFLARENTTLIWDSEQAVPFAINGDQWIGFDDERSLMGKVDWMKEKKLAGVLVWATDLDDFRGTCGPSRYPLMQAIHQALDGYRVPYTYSGGAGGGHSSDGKAANPGEVVCDNGDGEVTFHRDVLDCKHYYLCQGTVRHRMPCPSDLVFNEAESVCDWPENVEACWAFTQAPPPA